jgi:hypothetical protein
MTLPTLVDGALPLGRWSATLAEIEAMFVDGQCAKRHEVWTDWLQLTEALRDIVTLPAAWLGGSFFTEKEEPGDLDSVYVVEWAAVVAAKLSPDPRRAQLVQAIAANEVKDVFGLSVDSFILEWWPTPGPKAPGYAQGYRERRGYWDDLWSRRRSADPRQDAVPSRGYVEVIFDGYA